MSDSQSYEQYGFRHQDDEDQDEFCQRALAEAVKNGWRDDETAFRQIARLLSECLAAPPGPLAKSDPLSYFPFFDVAPSIMEELLELAAMQPSKIWLTAAIEVDYFLAKVKGGLSNPRSQSCVLASPAWQTADFESLAEMCRRVADSYPRLVETVEQFAVSGDIRRFCWFLESWPPWGYFALSPATERQRRGDPVPDELGDDRLEHLIRMALEGKPYEPRLWRALLRVSPSPSTLELAADLILPTVTEAAARPGVLAGSPAEGPLRDILTSGVIEPNDVGWVFVRKGLNASGASTRGTAADVLAHWDDSEWPADADTVVESALKREIDSAVRIKLGRLGRV